MPYKLPIYIENTVEDACMNILIIKKIRKENMEKGSLMAF